MIPLINASLIEKTRSGSAIRAMFEEGKRLASLYGTEYVYDFSLGNPSVPAPDSVKTALADIVENTEPLALHGYMSNAGYESTRKAVADDLNRRFGTAFSAGNVIMTVGAAGGLNVILRTLLNPGDEVIVFAPFFLEYGNYVENHGGVLKIVDTGEDFLPDSEALYNAISGRTKAVIINNPNNPTGAVYDEACIKRLAEALDRRGRELGESIYLISDEPYRELCYDGAEVPFLTKYYRNTIVSYSWCKSLSQPGERIGYLLIPSECDEASLIYDAAVIANRILGFVNAPALQQRLVERCLGEETDLEYYDYNRKALYKGLTDIGFECVYPHGAFYLWMKSPEKDDKAFCERAKKYNILLVPGSGFKRSGFVRLAYCVDHAMIMRSLDAFKKLFTEYESYGK